MKAPTTFLLTLIIATSCIAQEIAYVKMKSFKKPIVQAEINGKKSYFLIDTGSEISVINTGDLKKYKLEAKKLYGDHNMAIGFNGQKTAVMRIKNADVRLGDHFDHSKFFSLNINEVIKTIEAKTSIRISGILGTDVLTKYNCVIDYNQRHVILVDSRTKKHIAAK